MRWWQHCGSHAMKQSWQFATFCTASPGNPQKFLSKAPGALHQSKEMNSLCPFLTLQHCGEGVLILPDENSPESFISVTIDSSEPIHPFRCQKFSTSIFIVPFQCFRSSVWYTLKLKVSIVSRTSDHCHMHWLQRCSLLPPGMEKLSWSVKWGVWFRIAFRTIHFSQTSRKLD